MAQTELVIIERFFHSAMEAINQNEWEEAIGFLCKIIELKPTCAEAYNNLGLIFKNTNQLEQAEACLLKAIEFDPYCINAFYNLAMVYQNGEYLADAEICFRRVIELDAFNINTYNHLGVLLEKVFRLDEAEIYYRQAIAIDPDYADAYFNLGKLLQVTNRFSEAEKCFYRASELMPNHEHINIGIAFFHLSLGQYERGWKKYSEVLRKKHASDLIFSIPIWHGESLRNRTILLYCEQGLGDTIQFIRYVFQVASVAAQTVVLVQKPLANILAAALAPIKICSSEDVFFEKHDFACSLHLLPIIFKSEEHTIPIFSSYIQSLPAESKIWREKLKERITDNAYRIGIVWAGNPKNAMDRYRSIPFEIFSELFILKEVCWISLQVGDRANDCKCTKEVLDVSAELVDFSQTAGLIDNIDLVITMDTSVAHFAGAMGKKTWVLLDSYCDWRWQLDRKDTTWYPSMTLFRQKKVGQWEGVLDEVLVALKNMLMGECNTNARRT